MAEFTEAAQWQQKILQGLPTYTPSPDLTTKDLELKSLASGLEALKTMFLYFISKSPESIKN